MAGRRPRFGVFRERELVRQVDSLAGEIYLLLGGEGEGKFFG